MLGDGDTARLIIHRVEDVTEFVRMRDARSEQRQLTAQLRRRAQEMETDLFNRAHELQAVNQMLRAANHDLAATSAQLRREQGAKDRFLATLSHELRTPLAAIQGALEVLQHPAAEAEARAMLEVVERQVQALTTMTDDLLDITRAQVGKLQLLDRSDLDFASLALAAVETARTAANLERRAVTSELQDRTPWVRGDAVRLSQAIGNLVSNAVKFTAADGNVHVRVHGDASSVTLQVRDDGQGFDASRAEELFEPFTQQDASLARTTTGLGLGLPIVRGIAELHGGRAFAHSDGPGRGATFTLELPAIPRPAARPAPAKATDRATTAPLRVLLIEDNEDVATAYQALLHQLGHTPQATRSGITGIHAAQHDPPDVVLCDIGLPDIDGYEVARRLRADHITAKIPLLARAGMESRTAQAVPLNDGRGTRGATVLLRVRSALIRQMPATRADRVQVTHQGSQSDPKQTRMIAWTLRRRSARPLQMWRDITDSQHDSESRERRN